jgi:DNA-binding PadR family transcriptional regulator
MQQEVVLAMLAKEPSHGYELRTRLAQALGPVAEGISEAQMYVTLTRLGKGGFVARLDAPAQRSDRKVYCLTPAGQERVTEWMSDVSWPRPDLAEFHMKLIAAAQGALADPISLIDAQRRDLLRRTFLFTGATLLGLLALASVAVLVGGSLAEGTRRVGLLKASGGTPGLVAATFLAENLFLALVAALAGLLAGWRAAPLVSNPEADLVGTPGAPPLTLAMVVVALGVALAVAFASTLVPAIRAARMSTVSALADDQLQHWRALPHPHRGGRDAQGAGTGPRPARHRHRLLRRRRRHQRPRGAAGAGQHARIRPPGARGRRHHPGRHPGRPLPG